MASGNTRAVGQHHGLLVEGRDGRHDFDHSSADGVDEADINMGTVAVRRNCEKGSWGRAGRGRSGRDGRSSQYTNSGSSNGDGDGPRSDQLGRETLVSRRRMFGGVCTAIRTCSLRLPDRRRSRCRCCLHRPPYRPGPEMAAHSGSPRNEQPLHRRSWPPAAAASTAAAGNNDNPCGNRAIGSLHTPPAVLAAGFVASMPNRGSRPAAARAPGIARTDHVPPSGHSREELVARKVRQPPDRVQVEAVVAGSARLRHAARSRMVASIPRARSGCRRRESRGTSTDYDDLVHSPRLRLKNGAYGSRSASDRSASRGNRSRMVFARLNV